MIEHSIISNLLNNDEFTRKVIPYLRSEYFDDPSSRIVFTTFENYFNTYKSAPTKEALYVSLDKRRDLDENAFKEVTKYVEELTYDSKTDPEFLVSETERFCQEQDLYLTIRRAIGIIEGKDKDLDRGALPKLLQDSLGISFDTRIGHNYIDDAESRYEYYHREETRLPFDIDILNKITQGGVAQKSLTCFIGGTGTGKSLVMCHMAAANFMHGKNVLYITLELAEEEVSRRIDANLLDCEVGSIKEMPQEEFLRKINRVKSKSTGTLTVKEYPTGTMNANHIRHILNEIKVKQGISIDVIYLDYINLCTSFRVKNTNANSYTIVKSIAEEMRGLSMEYGIPVITATQPNREGMNSSDLELGNTSECIFVNEEVTLRNGEKIKIGDIRPGQQVIANDGYKTVSLVHHKKIKKCYKIKLKSGKTIMVSADHVFPTSEGRKCIRDGLSVGAKLHSK